MHKTDIRRIIMLYCYAISTLDGKNNRWRLPIRYALIRNVDELTRHSQEGISLNKNISHLPLGEGIIPELIRVAIITFSLIGATEVPPDFFILIFPFLQFRKCMLASKNRWRILYFVFRKINSTLSLTSATCICIRLIAIQCYHCHVRKDVS